MTSMICVSILPFLLSFSILLSNAQYCSDTGNFTTNSTYDQNRRLLLSSLASNVTADGGLSTMTVDQHSEKLYGLALCLDSSSPEDCSRCVNSAVDGLLKNCPNQKEAMFSWTWDRPCLVRYTNRSIFGKMELDPSTTLQFTNGDISSNITHFDQTWSSLMATLITTASSNNGSSTHQKYAAGVADLEAFKTIYALTVCTPDITASDCRYCLRQSVSRFQSCCYGKPGGVVQRPSCFFRWNLYPFLNAFANVSSASTPPPPPPTTPESVPSPPCKVAEEAENGNLSRLAIVVFVPTVIAMIAILCAVFYWGTKKREDEVTMLQEDCAIGTETTTETESFQFSLGTIEAATNNFANRLGGGGFGEVYKGTLRHGQQIAVKRLSSSSEQGAEEFKNEVMLLAKLQHRNLVQLLGFCLHENEKILVYEFMPNKSLDYFLFDPEKQRKLNWPRRYKIIRGIARGILYLHQDSQLRIIHRDLKAANILLDKHLNPKISDFGMARIFDVDQTKANTRRIVGTYGYMPPEYAMQGRFSDKSDTYSFGMLVLEIISGKKNSSYYQAHGAVNIVSYVWKHWKKNTALEVMDPTLSNSHSRDEVVRCIHIGLLCVQKDAAKRPTMATVVLMLETHSTSSLPLSQEPAFLFHSKPEGSSPSGDQSDQSGTRSSTISVDEATITELYPR